MQFYETWLWIIWKWCWPLTREYLQEDKTPVRGVIHLLRGFLRQSPTSFLHLKISFWWKCKKIVTLPHIATQCVLVQRIKFWVLVRLLPILVFVIVLVFWPSRVYNCSFCPSSKGFVSFFYVWKLLNHLWLSEAKWERDLFRGGRGEHPSQDGGENLVTISSLVNDGMSCRCQSRVLPARPCSWSSPTPGWTASRSCSTWRSCSTTTPTSPARWGASS